LFHVEFFLFLDVNIRFLVPLLFTANALFAQTSYVDPFIGTGKSNVLTRWGSEGGTYPGAVAPSGFIQLTPETRSSGYDFSDSTISFFTCTGHFSGFPTGSAGKLIVMPFPLQRRFSHDNEHATPGYYSVLFPDNNTLVEATVTERAGMFRFTFPAGVTPRLFVNDSGRFNPAIHYSEPYISKEGNVVTFKPATSGAKVILLSISVSMVSQESAERNITVELNAAFDEIRKRTLTKWAKALSVVGITDADSTNKTIFYTALYHSLLMPWIISDVDGKYRGADKKVHTVTGRVEYGGFSPWDTFRSLHPLLSLLFPDKQSEMVLSMLDIFQQTGHLPIESMTGNHAVPVIVDSYLKGVPGIDSTLAYTAMKKSIGDTPYLQSDMAIYHQQGYIPFSYPESVTRTVEYAYDDWALAQFAGQVMHRKDDYELFMKRSYNYRNLFYPDDMFMVPRQDTAFKREPGNSGYKEGDKWVYSYFVPQHQQDLINLMGGEASFRERLETALGDKDIIFDNETVFHVPYLFNVAGRSLMTQYLVSDIMEKRFSATPGGLPGNDDLGSTSSWYVLSAMGIYPICPGSPDYTITAPLFDSLKIHLQNGKDFMIRRTSKRANIGGIKINKVPLNDFLLPHSTILKGGEMVFEMGTPGIWPRPHNNDGRPDFKVLNYSVSKDHVIPDEPFFVKFTLQNNWNMGTMNVSIKQDHHYLASRNFLINKESIITDSLQCRLYYPGNAVITINGMDSMNISVILPDHPFSKKPVVNIIKLVPLIKIGDPQQLTFTAQNTGGITQTFQIPVTLNNKVTSIKEVTLAPGEKQYISVSLTDIPTGWQTVCVDDVPARFKVYATAEESLLLDLHGAVDSSGFGNNGEVMGVGRNVYGKDHFVEVPNAPSLDIMGHTLTMMAWVFPQGTDNGLTDMFTKGDFNVLQTDNGKTLTFFAGGWGRGDCSVPLPADWKEHWHHIAGVCYGDSLRLYIDGVLKGVTKLEGSVNLSGTNKWTFGRNEEFPSVRIFNGLIDNMKVFAEPLSEGEVKEMMLKNVHKATKITGARIM
jgi:putative alpha-1,2-mannosidase